MRVIKKRNQDSRTRLSISFIKTVCSFHNDKLMSTSRKSQEQQNMVTLSLKFYKYVWQQRCKQGKILELLIDKLFPFTYFMQKYNVTYLEFTKVKFQKTGVTHTDDTNSHQDHSNQSTQPPATKNLW